jgi:hypothetical protein
MLCRCVLVIVFLGTLVVAQDKREEPSSLSGEESVAEIATDRPDVTESPTVVPIGSLQFENGLAWSKVADESSVDLSQTLVRFGLTRRWELRLQAPDFFRYLGSPAEHAGFGDVAIGAKRQLGPLPGGFELAVIMAVSVPTGSGAASSHGVDPFVKFPWSRALTKSWSVGGQFSTFYVSENKHRNTLVEPCFYKEREIGARDEVFVEYVGDYHQHGRPGQILHAGTAYKLTPVHQIDCHAGVGLSRAAPDVFIAIGYSFRLDGLFGRNQTRTP